MSASSLRELIAGGESQTVEFKEELPSSTEKLAREMAAFANCEGGTIIIGVARNGAPVGVSDPDSVMERVANIARDAVKPSLTPRIRREDLEGHSLVIVEIPRQALPRQAQGKHYLRVGVTCREADSAEIAALYSNRPELADLARMYDAAFVDFRPRRLEAAQESEPSSAPDQWQQLEDMRTKLYRDNEGLFLIHRWRPSAIEGQVADISISLAQHGVGPLSRGEIESVEYQLGARFSTQRLIVTDASTNFRLDVSAYAPMLCLAKVTFKGDRQPLYLQRYIDFETAAGRVTPATPGA